MQWYAIGHSFLLSDVILKFLRGKKEAEWDGETEMEHHVFLQCGIHYTWVK